MKVHELQDHWTQVRAGLDEVLTKFQVEDLTFAPFPGGWNVAQILLHIASEEEIEILYGLARQIKDWPVEPDPAGFKTPEAIHQRLQDVHRQTEEFLACLTDSQLEQAFEPAWGGSQPLALWIGHTLDHEIHHRGELSLILGMLGREGLNA